MASGTINNMTLNASLYYGASRSRSGECILTTQVIGTFTEECYSIAGTWTDDGAAGQFQLNRVPITIIEPKTENDLIITAEPKMPAFKAVVAIDQFHSALLNATILPYTWHLVIDNEPIPGIRKFQMTLDDVSTTESNYEPDFNLLMAHETVQEKEVITPVTEGIVGGQLSLWVYYYKDNNSSNLYPASDLKIYNIKGTNPGQAAIESMLTDSMSQQIACQESRYKQFDADREGGISIPLIGKNSDGDSIGGAGIMQLYKPPPYDQYQSKTFHEREQARLNKDRKRMELPPCPPNIPTPLNSDQQIRDTIRRYNGGVEYRWEPRDAPNCEGQWLSEPSCIRDNIPCDKEYVEHVLNCNINN